MKMRTYIHIILIVFLITTVIISCKHQKENIENEQYSNLVNFLKKEVKIDITQRFIVILLQGTNCSCQEANLKFINNLLEKTNATNIVLIAKNDVNNKIKLAITAKDKLNTYFEDSEQILEQYGNIFVGDKIFLLENGFIIDDFILNKETYKIIKDNIL